VSACFAYPEAARYGRVVAKSRIYQHARVGKKLRQAFVDQVDRIVWRYKLAPETINLSATTDVAEIQVFTVELRGKELDEAVLRSIDRAIAFPVLFELTFDGERKFVAAYKRRNESDRAKWVISEYFESDWEAEEALRASLPRTLNLEGLYEQLLSRLLPEDASLKEPLYKRVERLEVIRAKQREVERIKALLAKEKQFNKRVQINAQLRNVTKELKRLGATAAD
jgi:hypothetical protein